MSPAAVVPPTLVGLLEERLDRLTPKLRRTLEHASIEGEVFHRGGVAALGSNISALEELVSLGLIHPARAVFIGEAAYRFHHLLVRDVAYAGTTKRARSQMHQRFAEWLETRATASLYDEILGYHYEQAYAYARQLTTPDDRARALAERAGRYLGAAGIRASRRGDVPAATTLLTRAARFVSEVRERALVLFELANTRDVYGNEDEARQLAAEVRELAQRTDDPTTRWRAFLLGHDDGPGYAAYAAKVEAALPELEQLGDDELIGRALILVADAQHDPLPNIERALTHFEHAGNERTLNMVLGRYGTILNASAMPPGEVIERLTKLLARADGKPERQAPLLVQIARALNQLGRFEEARDYALRGVVLREELGQRMNLALGALPTLAATEVGRGDLDAAERHLRRAIAILEDAGKPNDVSWPYSFLATLLFDRGRLADDDDLRSAAAALDVTDGDARSHLLRTRALLASADGDHTAAEAAALEAVELARSSKHGRVLPAFTNEVLARVYRAAERLDDAARAAEEAARVWESVGAVSHAARSRALLRARV